MLDVRQVIATMLKDIAGTRCFCGPESEANSAATVVLAKACTCFTSDVDEEVTWDDQVTCYNCRYRRWNTYGFSCYKNFPVPEDLS